MPMKGRPRLSPDEVQARITAYCTRYGVSPNADGLPPFPTGRRETRQHREWIGVYKAQRRLLGRPAAGTDESPLEDREPLHGRQHGLCPVCGKKVALSDPVDRAPASRQPRGLLHAGCRDLVALVEPSGPEGLERLRAYLWPRRTSGRR